MIFCADTDRVRAYGERGKDLYCIQDTAAAVQNALLNLPGLSDGSITVIDLAKGEVVGSVDTLKDMGLNPNSLVLLPEWNHFAGH